MESCCCCCCYYVYLLENYTSRLRFIAGSYTSPNVDQFGLEWMKSTLIKSSSINQSYTDVEITHLYWPNLDPSQKSLRPKNLKWKLCEGYTRHDRSIITARGSYRLGNRENSREISARNSSSSRGSSIQLISPICRLIIWITFSKAMKHNKEMILQHKTISHWLTLLLLLLPG